MPTQPKPIESRYALRATAQIVAWTRAARAVFFCLLVAWAAPVAAQEASAHYYWRPAAQDEAPRPWALLLTGASGLSIGQYDQHYFRAASWLNERGVDALIVDYQRAVRLVPAAQQGAPGERIAAVAADAIAVQRAEGHALGECPAAAIVWSLGGEGGWLLARENAFALRGVAFYYPTTILAPPYANTAPVLILQGDADDVTPLARLQAFVGSRPSDAAPLELIVFPGAYHGFDVPSLPTSLQVYRDLAAQGTPSDGTFIYDAAAAAEAERALEHFLRDRGVIGGRCG